MRRSTCLSILFSLAAMFLCAGIALSQSRESPDRTLSPYFFVKSDTPDLDPLPLKSTSALVNIAGVIADVRVTQVYRNEGAKPLEAIYIFPASTRVAVYGMKMTIGERIIEAKIARREDARREYEQAREQGRSASLLEQQKPNVFQMNVANILPGDEMKVELLYTELLVPTEGIYEFIYPTVVGPRYSNKSQETTPPSEQWLQNPYHRRGEAPSYTFDLTVHIAAGIPIKDLRCPSHRTAPAYSSPESVMVTLDKGEAHGGNRDYILRYRLDGDRIQSGLLLYEGEKENFFLLMMQPPKRVAQAQIPGREYIFIVDVSGSMHGFPLEISKKLLKDLIGNLRPTDCFNVLLFSGGSSLLAEESLPATPENIRQALNLIQRQRGGGGTELLPALKRALSLKKEEKFSRTIVIATDGYVAVEEEVFDLIRNNLRNANMFTFGIGTAVNRHILEGMARVGMGEPFVITRPEDAPAQAERFRAMIQSPVLSGINLDFYKFPVYDVEPVTIPDVLAERPVIVFGKWNGRARGKITLSGFSGNGPYEQVIEVEKARPSQDHSALRYLWARHRITLLSDYNLLRPNDQRKSEVTELGLEYNLLTAYTSFLAVDTQARNQSGEVTSVKQPLPLPEGISDYAVGGRMMKMAIAASAPLPRMEAPAALEEKAPLTQQVYREPEKKRIALEKIFVSDKDARQTVIEALTQKVRELEMHYAGKEASGRVSFRLTFGPDGMVNRVTIVSSSLKNKSLHKDLIEEIKKWQFPVSMGQETKVTFSLVLG